MGKSLPDRRWLVITEVMAHSYQIAPKDQLPKKEKTWHKNFSVEDKTCQAERLQARTPTLTPLVDILFSPLSLNL